MNYPRIFGAHLQAFEALRDKVHEASQEFSSRIFRGDKEDRILRAAQGAISHACGFPVIVNHVYGGHGALGGVSAEAMPCPFDAETREVAADLFEARGYANFALWLRGSL